MMPRKPTTTERIADLQKQRAKLLAEQVAAKRSKDPEALRRANAALASWTENLRLNEEIAEQERLDAEAEERRHGYAYLAGLGESGLNGMRECLQLAIATDRKLNEAFNGVQGIDAKVAEVGRAICQLDPKFDPAGLKMMLSDCFRQTLINHGFVNGFRTSSGEGQTITAAVQNYVGRVEGILRTTLPRLRRQHGIPEKTL